MCFLLLNLSGKRWLKMEELIEPNVYRPENEKKPFKIALLGILLLYISIFILICNHWFWFVTDLLKDRYFSPFILIHPPGLSNGSWTLFILVWLTVFSNRLPLQHLLVLSLLLAADVWHCWVLFFPIQFSRPCLWPSFLIKPILSNRLLFLSIVYISNDWIMGLSSSYLPCIHKLSDIRDYLSLFLLSQWEIIDLMPFV